MKVVFADVDNGLMLKKKGKTSPFGNCPKISWKIFRDERSQNRSGFLKVKGEKER